MYVYCRFLLALLWYNVGMSSCEYMLNTADLTTVVMCSLLWWSIDCQCSSYLIIANVLHILLLVQS